MMVKVQLVICADDERTDTIHDVAILEKDCQRIEQLGLTLAETKQLLTTLQQHRRKAQLSPTQVLRGRKRETAL